MADRHQFRANWHDYNDGIYFVTVCCAHRAHLLGRISRGKMILSETGEELRRWIEKLNETSKFEIINHVIMPNHFHILVGTRFCASTSSTGELPISSTGNIGCLKPSKHVDSITNFHHNSALAIFIGNLKGGIVRFANRKGLVFKWQARYYEHIVRHQRAFNNIMNYIDNNIANWEQDCFNQSVLNGDDNRPGGK